MTIIARLLLFAGGIALFYLMWRNIIQPWLFDQKINKEIISAEQNAVKEEVKTNTKILKKKTRAKNKKKLEKI